MLILALSSAFAADLRLEATLRGAGGFGTSVSAGDVDGDGHADLVVGQPLLEGFVVHHGGASGLAEVAASGYQGHTALYAASLAVADVDGNGFGDVVVGDPESDALDLYLAGPYGLGGLAATYGGYERIGITLNSAGDTNGDGLEDIVAGGPSELYGFPGAPSGLGNGLLLAVPPGEWFGRVPATGIGDVDGDGNDDVAAATPHWDALLGRISVFRGSSAAPAVEPTWTVQTGEARLFGMALGAAGDVDADGYADLVALSPSLEADGGTAWLVRGSADGPRPPTAFASAPSSSTEGSLGHGSVSGVGDLDADGFTEVAVVWVDAENDGGQTIARLWVFRGGAEGLIADPWFDTGRISTGTHLGQVALGPAGDVDGDGLPEMYLGLGPLDEVRVFGSDGAWSPDDTDPPDDTDTTDTDEEGIALGGRGCTCATGRPAGAAGALLLGLVLLSARRRAGLRSRP